LSVGIHETEVQAAARVEGLSRRRQRKEPEPNLVLRIASEGSLALIVDEVVAGELLQEVHRHTGLGPRRQVSRSDIQIDRISIDHEQASVQHPRLAQHMPHPKGVNVIYV